MAFDPHANFSYSTVATAPSPPTSGTSLVVAAGDGTKFPSVSFNATIWPAGAQPTSANAEIVRVTTISTDTFTITRAQESSSARTVVVGDQIAATVTKKTLTDIESGGLLTSSALATNAVGAANLATTAIKLAIASIVASPSTFSASTTIITMTSVAVPTGGRDIKLEVIIPQVSSSVTGDRLNVAIKESSTILQQFYIGMGANGWAGTLTAVSGTAAFATPSSGNHTYTVVASRDVGTGVITWYADGAGATSSLVAYAV